MTVVLDSWAVVALLRNESAASKVERAIDEGRAAACEITLGEALYVLSREFGEQRARPAIDQVRRGIELIAAEWSLIAAAAAIKQRGGVSYADAFCIATARRLQAPLWTGDPEIIENADGVKVVDLR